MTPNDAYQWLAEHSRETAYMKSMGRVLGWDQRTHIPAKGHAHRHHQFAMLAKWIHLRATDPRVGEALACAEASDLVSDPGADPAVNLREWRRDFDRNTKIPQDLAVALAKATAEGETAWERTRPAGDWETFKPFLVTVVDLKREEAQALATPPNPMTPSWTTLNQGRPPRRWRLSWKNSGFPSSRFWRRSREAGGGPRARCCAGISR